MTHSVFFRRQPHIVSIAGGQNRICIVRAIEFFIRELIFFQREDIFLLHITAATLLRDQIVHLLLIILVGIRGFEFALELPHSVGIVLLADKTLSFLLRIYS